MRSQNRETLIPIKEELKLSKGKYVQSTISSYRPQQFYNIFHKENILGEYKTKERALEVLDEIQERVDFNIKLKLETCVYEMPKE